MAFTSNGATDFPGNGELTYVVNAVSGGTLHALVSRSSNGENRAIGVTFQPSGVSQSIAPVEIDETGDATITDADAISGVIDRVGATADFEDTLPDAADWQAAWIGGGIGQSYVLTIRNQTAFVQTLAGGTGVTIGTTIYIPPSGVQSMLVVWTSIGIEVYALAAARVDGRAPFALRELDETTGELTASLLTGADQIYIESVNALPGNQQFPATVNMVQPMGGALPGQSWAIRIMNSGAGTLTLTADTGATVTLVGTMTVAQNKYRDFLVQLTDNYPTWTATVTSVGAGDFD